MPGAELQEVEGDEYRGVVKVKVGPITAQYKGKARFSEKDDDLHRAVLQAEGRDTRGQGNASATVTAIATADDDGTVVSLVTELTITGKVAQFGRSIMADISAKMLGEFADRLEADVLRQGSDVAEPEPPIAESSPQDSPRPDGGPAAVRTIHSAPAEPVDLLSATGPSVLKRLLPLGGVLGLVLLLWRLRKRTTTS
jgi:hypothetical protein